MKLKPPPITRLYARFPETRLTLILEGPEEKRRRRALALAIFRKITAIFGIAQDRDIRRFESGWIIHDDSWIETQNRDAQSGISLRQAVRTESDLQSIGFQIRTARLKLRWSQSVLAERTGLERTHISRIERARCRMHPATLARIESALACGRYDAEHKPHNWRGEEGHPERNDGLTS